MALNGRMMNTSWAVELCNGLLFKIYTVKKSLLFFVLKHLMGIAFIKSVVHLPTNLGYHLKQEF